MSAVNKDDADQTITQNYTLSFAAQVEKVGINFL